MSRRKFSVGDKVKVVKDMCIYGAKEHGIKLGRKGIVVKIEPGMGYPYRVRFRGEQVDMWFNARELEKVEG